MKCDACPIAGPCYAERPGRAFACRFARPDAPASERHFLLGASGEPAPPEPVAGPGPARPGRDLRTTLRLVAAYKACPDRSERTDCGCAGLASCARGRGREGVVTINDCLDCLDPQTKDAP